MALTWPEGAEPSAPPARRPERPEPGGRGRDGCGPAVVGAAAAGDLVAFEALVRATQDRTFRLCLRMLGNRDDAEDATQDALVQAWSSLDRYRGQSSFSTWLYRISVNRCLDRLRARRPTEPLDDDLPSVPVTGPDRVAEGRAQLAALESAVRALTPEQRAAFVLREVEGASYSEIAEVLGISVAAVKSRLNRARSELVRAMEGWS
ncbi:MAG: RNA polymerase sigma factor [Acidimicrobiales bacterium]